MIEILFSRQQNKLFLKSQNISLYNNFGRAFMNSDDKNDKSGSEILELSELSLFQEDPFSPEVSVLDQRQEISSEEMHLLDGQVLFREKPYFVGIEGDSKLIMGDYEGFVSNYRALFFAVNKQDRRHSIITNHSKIPVSIPFAMMSEIDIIKSQVMLKLKTGISLRIKSSIAQGQQLYRHFLKAYMAIPFFPKSVFPHEQCINYDCLVEIQRMRINWDSLIMVKNANGQLCSTYPKYFVVPKKIESNLLEQCLKIRNFNRIPIVTYYWNECRTALWRAARLCQQSNKFDQAYMKQISRQPFIINIRQEEMTTRQNYLMASSTMGMKFLPINIVDNLFKRLCVSYAKDQKTIFKVLEPWYDDINRLIKCAYLAVDMMKTGKLVIIVENLGFDRACQVCALAQILMDPFYRTIHGFGVLVEKQFMSFGHQFNLRLGYDTERLSEQSPIFVQFLECVYHLSTSHPRCFEFSGAYLARIAYEAFAAKYNNFFFNDEGEKKKYELYLRTPNIWKHLPMRKTYYNYQWNECMAEKLLIVLRVAPSVKQYVLWNDFYELMSDMRGEFPDEMNAKRRRSSIYKRINDRSPSKCE